VLASVGRPAPDVSLGRCRDNHRNTRQHLQLVDGFFVDVENAANSNLLLAHVPITWQTTGCPSIRA
jgi:hypothetical protein